MVFREDRDAPRRSIVGHTVADAEAGKTALERQVTGIRGVFPR